MSYLFEKKKRNRFPCMGDHFCSNIKAVPDFISIAILLSRLSVIIKLIIANSCFINRPKRLLNKP